MSFIVSFKRQTSKVFLSDRKLSFRNFQKGINFSFGKWASLLYFKQEIPGIKVVSWDTTQTNAIILF